LSFAESSPPPTAASPSPVIAWKIFVKSSEYDIVGSRPAFSNPLTLIEIIWYIILQMEKLDLHRVFILYSMVPSTPMS
jgi:hypothetical protein